MHHISGEHWVLKTISWIEYRRTNEYGKTVNVWDQSKYFNYFNSFICIPSAEHNVMLDARIINIMNIFMRCMRNTHTPNVREKKTQ